MENKSTVKTKAELQRNSDEWFINNLIAMASVTLALAKKEGTTVNRHELARWAFNHAQGN